MLALPSVVPFDLAVPVQVFGYPRPDLGAKRYDAIVCGTHARGRSRVQTSSCFALQVPAGLDALRRAETIVVPGIDDLELPIAPAVTRALRAAHARGARIVSICTGVFALAEAGLLDGRRATTHWGDVEEFCARYPRVRLDPNVLYVDEGQVLTSAGIAAGIDLCLHVVRLDHGAAVANAVARRLVVAPHRSGGQAQFIPQPVAEPTGVRLEPTRQWMLERLADASLTVERAAQHAGMPVRSFVRHFVAEAGTPPLRWLLRQRILAAQQLLELGDAGVDRIARDCGFGSAVSLRLHFRRALGTSPLAYRRTFRRKGEGVRRGTGRSRRQGASSRRVAIQPPAAPSRQNVRER